MTEAQEKLQQCRQLVCALVHQYGADSEHGRFLDVDDVFMLMATEKTDLLIGYLPSMATVRLLIPTAKPSPEIPTTLQTQCPKCEHTHVGRTVCFWGEQCDCPNTQETHVG